MNLKVAFKNSGNIPITGNKYSVTQMFQDSSKQEISLYHLKCGISPTVKQALYDTTKKTGSTLYFSEPLEASNITVAKQLCRDKNCFVERPTFPLI